MFAWGSRFFFFLLVGGVVSGPPVYLMSVCMLDFFHCDLTDTTWCPPRPCATPLASGTTEARAPVLPRSWTLSRAGSAWGGFPCWSRKMLGLFFEHSFVPHDVVMRKKDMAVFTLFSFCMFVPGVSIAGRGRTRPQALGGGSGPPREQTTAAARSTGGRRARA